MKFKLLLFFTIFTISVFAQQQSPFSLLKSESDSLSTHYSVNLYNSMGTMLDNIEVDVYDNFYYFLPFEKCEIPGFYFIVAYSEDRIIKKTLLR